MRSAESYRLSSVSENVLITKLVHGDEGAFVHVFRVYYPHVRRFVARYTESAQAAEDITQDTFVTLWERRTRLDPTRSLRAYLLTIARNRAYDVHDHARVLERFQSDPVQAGSALSSLVHPLPDELAFAQDLMRLAEARVALLSPRLREVYHLSRSEGFTAAEIAQILGTSVQTVYTQLAKITDALYPVLRQWLDE